MPEVFLEYIPCQSLKLLFLLKRKIFIILLLRGPLNLFQQIAT